MNKANIRGIFENIAGKVFDFSPENVGRGNVSGSVSFIHHLFDDGVIGYKETKLTTPTTLDLTTTGANGILDGLAFENGREYLIWAFQDCCDNYTGMGITRKPYLPWSSFSGSGAKGGTIILTVAGDGYQFVIGSRVVVRNQDGTAPYYEYNWGTVTIVTDTTITVLLDNISDYGTVITGSTAGDIKQWDKFIPSVISPTGSAQLYDYYSLIGELKTDLATGDIKKIYRVDEPWRDIWEEVAFYDYGLGATSLARTLPLWATMVISTVRILSTGDSAYGHSGDAIVTNIVQSQVAGRFNYNTTSSALDSTIYALTTFSAFGDPASDTRTVFHNYYVGEGMRG